MRKDTIFLISLITLILLSTILGYGLSKVVSEKRVIMFPENRTEYINSWYDLKNHILTIKVRLPNTTKLGVSMVSNKTFSMSPALGANTKLLAIKLNASEYNVGDIITFRLNNENIVHRIIYKGYDNQGLYFITKGDANPYTDGKIRPSQIDGVVIGVFY